MSRGLVDLDTVGLFTEFPIPMRGNELQALCDVIIEGRTFPIPMRGNETVVGFVADDLTTTVSNPHEG